jgi:hypothetical protein
VRERVRGSSAHMLHTREKQTKRFSALSEHQHASTHLGVQCMNALMLCVWPDHACPSLGPEVCVCVCLLLQHLVQSCSRGPPVTRDKRMRKQRNVRDQLVISPIKKT